MSAAAVGGIASPLVRRALVGSREHPRRLATGGAVLLAAGLLVAGSATGLVLALVGFALVGFGKPALDAASIAHVAEHTTYRERARYTSLMELTWAGGLLVVAPVAGWIIGRTSWRVPLFALAATILALAVWQWRVLDDPATADGRQRADGRTDVDVTVVLLLTATALFFLAQELTFVVFGVWLEQDFGATTTGLGGLAAAVGAAELVGSSLVLTVADRVGKTRTAVGGLAISTVGFAALPLVTSTAPAVTAMAIGLMGFEIAIVAVIPVASELWPASRSRFITILYAIAGTARAVGAGAGPPLFAVGGIAATAAGSVGGQLLAAGLLVALLRRGGPRGSRSLYAAR